MSTVSLIGLLSTLIRLLEILFIARPLSFLERILEPFLKQ